MTVDYLPPPRKLPEQRVAELRAELESFARTHPLGKRRRWRRRSVIGGVGALVVVAAGGGTALAVALLHPRPVTDHSVARCYTVAAYEPHGPFPGTSIAQASADASQAVRVANALDVCAAMWRAGILQPGAPRPIVHAGQPFYPVPALVGCTLPNGVAAVFPGAPDTCQRLGVAPEDPPAFQPAQPLSSSPTAAAH